MLFCQLGSDSGGKVYGKPQGSADFRSRNGSNIMVDNIYLLINSFVQHYKKKVFYTNETVQTTSIIRFKKISMKMSKWFVAYR